MIGLYALLTTAFAQEESSFSGGATPAYNIQLFSPQPDGFQGFMLSEGSLPTNTITSRLVFHSSGNLLRYRDYNGEVQKIVGSTSEADLFIGYNLFSTIRFAFGLPVILGAQSDTIQDLSGGIGDIKFNVKLAPINSPSYSVGFVFDSSVPTSRIQAPLANDSFVWSGVVAAELKLFKGSALRFNVGHQAQPTVSYENYSWGSGAVLGIGFSLPLANFIPDLDEATAEAMEQFDFGLTVENRNLAPYSTISNPSQYVSEGLFGLWGTYKPLDLTARLGTGFGFTGTPGTASSRFLLDVTYSPTPKE